MAGNSNSGQRKDKLIADALRMAAVQVVKGDKLGRSRLRIAAEKVVLAAMDGDLPSFRELADRLDGKAIQQNESTVDVTVTHFDARDRLQRKLKLHATPGTEAAIGADRVLN